MLKSANSECVKSEFVLPFFYHKEVFTKKKVNKKIFIILWRILFLRNPKSLS
jgi:hypothetical protein